jgi:hypothetical protein
VTFQCLRVRRERARCIGYGFRVPLVAAAVCPHPPLLVPQVASGAAEELAGVREACDTAVDALAAAQPDRLVVVGTDSNTREFRPPYRASLAPWGVALDVVAPPPGVDAPALPLSLLVGAWLLRRRGSLHRWPVRMQAVRGDATAGECARVAGELTAAPGRVAMLCMGDGAARHGEKAPGYADPRAEAFDAEVARALADGDPAALRALDAGLAGELMAAGRAAWQVLAAAAGDRRWRAELRYADHPYGVGYLVASWS